MLTAILMFVIMAVATDTRAVGEAAAIAVGGTIGLDAMFGGPISGASMNPMRSAGPAIVAGNLHSLWVYLVAPPIGAAIGALAYQFIRAESPASSTRSRPLATAPASRSSAAASSPGSSPSACPSPTSRVSSI